MNLIKYTNAEWEEECALYDVDDNKVIKIWDYYHDKIGDWINGFVSGLSYDEIEFSIEEKFLNKSDDMFIKLGFYYG